MLKRLDSPYLAGRPKGFWYKWKRDPMIADCVMMYAQRGHGKRSSFYSDFTFGVWDADKLVPVGKAYFGFTDEELKGLDRFVRQNTINRFGRCARWCMSRIPALCWKLPSRACRNRPAIARASRCASHASTASGMTRSRRMPTGSKPSGRFCGGHERRGTGRAGLPGSHAVAKEIGHACHDDQARETQHQPQREARLQPRIGRQDEERPHGQNDTEPRQQKPRGAQRFLA